MGSYSHYFDFSDKRVLVTGAAGGIGEAVARAFAEQRAQVLLADYDGPAAEAVAASLGERARAFEYNQENIESVEALAQAAVDVDVLVNNAGVVLREPLLELSWEDLRRVVDVNLVGVIALARLLGERMVARRSGAIINIGSQMAFNGARLRAVYSSTKAAITQFTKTAAVEWGEYGVRVNCIAPGKTITSINRHLLDNPAEFEAGLRRTPLKRYAEPGDIANIAIFLASEASSFVTGHTLVADGGWILE